MERKLIPTNPIEFTPAYIKDSLTKAVYEAVGKVNGDNSHDIPSTNWHSDDDTDPVETLLTVYLNKIVDTLNTKYETSAQRKEQLKLEQAIVRLITASRNHPQYKTFLLPRLEEKLIPNKSGIVYINGLTEIVYNARRRIEGDTSKDEPAKDYINDDKTTPVDELNVFFDDIVDILRKPCIVPEEQESWNKLHDEYMNLIASAEQHKPYLAPRYKELLDVKGNPSVNRNGTNINDLVS